MFGFHSPAFEIELAKAVRAEDIAAANRFRAARAARAARRSHDGDNVRPKTQSGVASTPRPARSAGIGAPQRSSG